MPRACALLLLAPLAALAQDEPGVRSGIQGEADLLERWQSADPDERRHLNRRLDELDRARRFAEARPVLVVFLGKTYPLAELFEGVLEPPLAVPVAPQRAGDLGLTLRHRLALDALGALRAAYAAPRAVHAGTLNLLLGYAHRAITAEILPPEARLRFFTEALRNVRDLDGRVTPDRRTRWLVHSRLLPSLLGLARRLEDDRVVREAVSEAASLLYMPSILDERAQELLAPLTRGSQSRRILRRAYRQGALDDLGVIALARSVSAQTHDDAAFAAGAPPLILELLSDPDVPPRERGELLDAVWKTIAPVEVLHATAVDLLAAGYGGTPRSLAEYRARRDARKGPVPAPQAREKIRFLSVVMVADASGGPPEIASVVRADVPFYAPIHRQGGGSARGFVGILVPAPGGEHADFLGPPPGLSGARDNRLLRRTLRLERIAIRTFGARGEVYELSVALPEDASEPVPIEGAGLTHLLTLVESRLRRAADEEEFEDLVRLCVRIDTNEARRLASTHARTSGSVAALLPLAEGGDVAAGRALLARIRLLDLPLRERAFAALVRSSDAGLLRGVVGLCRDEDVSLAALAADALLATGEVSGVRALVEHGNRYARACASSLLLRLTPLAGTLRITPRDKLDLPALQDRCAGSFEKEKGEAWTRYGDWLEDAFHRPEKVSDLRTQFRHIKLRDRLVSPSQFADYCLALLAKPKFRKYWVGLAPYVLAPYRPGRGMPDALLEEILDAFERRLEGNDALRESWIDSLVLLACAQYGMEADAHFLDLVHERLSKVAGEDAPPGVRRKPGIYWPIWAARQARR